MIEKKTNVSIIIPTYNRAHLINKAIQTILSQTYQDFEVIVVDDGSTDNTEEVIRKFQKRDKRIRYVKHKKNKGAAAARNTGIINSKGKYIAFQDSDVEWFPNKLEKQMKIFKNVSCDVGVVYTGLWKMIGNKKIYIPQSWVKQKEGYILKELLKGNFIDTPAMMIKKECLDKVGLFDDKLPRFQDWELAIRLSEVCRFVYINEPLFISPYLTDSISSNNVALVEALKIILEKHYRTIQKDKSILSRYLYWIGDNLCENGNIKKGKKFLMKSIIVYPINIKAYIRLAILLLGNNFYAKARKILKRLKFGE